MGNPNTSDDADASEPDGPPCAAGLAEHLKVAASHVRSARTEYEASREKLERSLVYYGEISDRLERAIADIDEHAGMNRAFSAPASAAPAELKRVEVELPEPIKPADRLRLHERIGCRVAVPEHEGAALVACASGDLRKVMAELARIRAVLLPLTIPDDENDIPKVDDPPTAGPAAPMDL